MFCVSYRSNSGEDFIIHGFTTKKEARKVARSVQITDNHMVCVEDAETGERISRWDRSRVVGENHWERANPDGMEVLGPIRTVTRVKALARDRTLAFPIWREPANAGSDTPPRPLLAGTLQELGDEVIRARATFPASMHLLAACTEVGGLVLDPFAGSGTTLKVALECGRSFVGYEINPAYCNLIRDRLGLFAGDVARNT